MNNDVIEMQKALEIAEQAELMLESFDEQAKALFEDYNNPIRPLLESTYVRGETDGSLRTPYQKMKDDEQQIKLFQDLGYDPSICWIKYSNLFDHGPYAGKYTDEIPSNIMATMHKSGLFSNTMLAQEKDGNGLFFITTYEGKPYVLAKTDGAIVGLELLDPDSPRKRSVMKVDIPEHLKFTYKKDDLIKIAEKG